MLLVVNENVKLGSNDLNDYANDTFAHCRILIRSGKRNINRNKLCKCKDVIFCMHIPPVTSSF